jgi:hypothetical protein
MEPQETKQIPGSHKNGRRSTLSPRQIRQVTDKVYTLLLRDLRIERERRPHAVKSRRHW